MWAFESPHRWSGSQICLIPPARERQQSLSSTNKEASVAQVQWKGKTITESFEHLPEFPPSKVTGYHKLFSLLQLRGELRSFDIWALFKLCLHLDLNNCVLCNGLLKGQASILSAFNTCKVSTHLSSEAWQFTLTQYTELTSTLKSMHLCASLFPSCTFKDQFILNFWYFVVVRC